MLFDRRVRVRGALLALLTLLGCDGGAVDPPPDGGSTTMDASADAGGAADGAADGGGAVDGAADGGGGACDDADRDGECDADDGTCNADGTRLACRRVAPECEAGTVPEVREGCYTDRCVTWAQCAELVGPPACASDADCAPAEVCRLGACGPAACEVRATVPLDDPFYERFEGVGADNACARDEDCFVSGCSGEVCAAELVPSTCEGLPRHPSGGCGCVEGQCIWHVVDCGPGPRECGSDAECREGHVCIAGTCVEASCERAPTVSPRDRYYERFEGIGLANRCASDVDCVVGGCSGEVCAAEGAATTCEGLPYGPEGGCGCVAGECVWYRDACDPPVNACEPIRDGELGFCDLVLGWGVSATTGACSTISGCGCEGDPTCGGRIFESEEACARACHPGLCFRDDVPITCRAPTPVCPPGTLAEVRRGCYTGECVSPEGCLPPPSSCARDTDCARGQVCRDGRCVEAPPACAADLDCPRGTVCRDGACVPVAPGCRTDADCPAGHACSDGLCVAVECRAVPTVSPDDRFYDRFEGTRSDNRCRTGADCVRSGCSGEVCAAESVATTCELLPYGPAGDCGCVEGQCIWHRLDCGAPAACAPIRPGEFGFCRLVMGWGVGALSGRCELISGCGCGDGSACEGRIFPSEVECRRACASDTCDADADGDGVCDAEDSTCNSDGSALTCRRVAPPCARGTVPEVRDSCYTDRCVSWAECARISGR